MKITDFVQQRLIVPQIASRTKPEVIEELAGHLAQTVGLNRPALVRVLLDREKLASTAIGEGVAIPHGKLDAAKVLVACIGRSTEGIDFESMDGRPTHIFFVLVAPESSTGAHLKALARISRLFKSVEFRERLMKAADAADMFQVIAEEDAKY